MHRLASDNQSVGRIIAYFKPQSKRFTWVSILVALIVGDCRSFLPVIVSHNENLLQNQPSMRAIIIAGLSLAFIGVSTWGLNWACRSLVIRSIGDVVLALRTQAFDAAAEHDRSFYDQFSSGRIVSRITSDTNDFGQLVVIVTDVTAQLATALILGVVMFYTEWHMALLMCAFIPFMLGLTTIYRNLARRVTRNGMIAMAEVNQSIKETVSGISIAKNFRQEQSIFVLTYRINNRIALMCNVASCFRLFSQP